MIVSDNRIEKDSVNYQRSLKALAFADILLTDEQKIQHHKEILGISCKSISRLTPGKLTDEYESLRRKLFG